MEWFLCPVLRIMNIAVQIEGLKRNNIGDVLQAIAVADYLPQAPAVLDREDLPGAAGHGQSLLFANGWYMHDYSKFPPPPNLIPVYASVHFSNAAILQKRENIEHFKKHGPIGSRDRKTLFMLRAAGVPSYYSGCFTAALKPRSSGCPNGELLVVDGVDHKLPDSAVEEIGHRLGMQTRRVSHDPNGNGLPFNQYAEHSFARAEELLRTYCGSSMVVTTKIHCALPCLAMGVPVVLVHPNPSEERLAPAAEFLKVVDLKKLGKLGRHNAIVLHPEKLRARQKWVADFISAAVECGGNPVASSPKFAELKIKAALDSRLWFFALRACHRLGIQRQRLAKIIDADSCQENTN
jgi:hypothetical protein